MKLRIVDRGQYLSIQLVNNTKLKINDQWTMPNGFFTIKVRNQITAVKRFIIGSPELL